MSLKKIIQEKVLNRKKPMKETISVMARIPVELKQLVDVVMERERAAGQTISWQILIEAAAEKYLEEE